METDLDFKPLFSVFALKNSKNKQIPFVKFYNRIKEALPIKGVRIEDITDPDLLEFMSESVHKQVLNKIAEIASQSQRSLDKLMAIQNAMKSIDLVFFLIELFNIDFEDQDLVY